MNYKIVKQGPTTHFFPMKALQYQKRYLHQGLFKPLDSNICKFISCIENIYKYLGHFPPFRTSQLIPDNEIIDLVEFFISRNCHKNIFVKVFDSDSKSLNKLVEFWEILKTVDGAFQDKGDGTHQNKNSKQSCGSHQS